MVADVEIANRAITKLGGQRITSLQSDTTEGRAIKSMYDIARRAIIRRALWNFAKVRTTLPAASLVPSWGFNYQYALPVDFLRLVQVNDFSESFNLIDVRTQQEAPYQLEGGYILTNYAAPLKIRYLRDVMDANQFDTCFIEAFACQLAFECCETVTASNTKKAALAQEVKGWIAEAVKCNEVENPPDNLQDDSWLLSRY